MQIKDIYSVFGDSFWPRQVGRTATKLSYVTQNSLHFIASRRHFECNFLRARITYHQESAGKIPTEWGMGHSFTSACKILSKAVSFHSKILSPSKASEPPILFPHHLQLAGMFVLRRSDENELERRFLPARFASRVEHAWRKAMSFLETK